MNLEKLVVFMIFLTFINIICSTILAYIILNEVYHMFSKLKLEINKNKIHN